MGLPVVSRNAVMAVLAAALFFLPSAEATTITFVATDLTDVNPGENLWQYDYTVSGRNFLQSEFFDIYFDPLLFASLTAGPAPNSDWDVTILQQPNPVNIPPFDVGIFDAFALQNIPSLTGSFSVRFVFLGAGSPGSQPFEVFDASASLIESSSTSPAVQEIPEPSTTIFLALALAAVFRRASRITQGS